MNTLLKLAAVGGAACLAAQFFAPKVPAVPTYVAPIAQGSTIAIFQLWSGEQVEVSLDAAAIPFDGQRPAHQIALQDGAVALPFEVDDAGERAVSAWMLTAGMNVLLRSTDRDGAFVIWDRARVVGFSAAQS